MEHIEPIRCETPQPKQEKKAEDLVEEINLKKDQDEYKIQFGIKEDNLNIKIFVDNSKDVFFYQKSYTLNELKKLSKIFSLYETLKDTIEFFKDLNFEIEEKGNDLMLKFKVFLPNGKNQEIEMRLTKNLLDSNQMVNYLHEKVKSIENNMKNLEKNANEERHKYESEIKELKDICSKNQEKLTKFSEIIVNFRDELSNLKEENKKIMRELNILKGGTIPKEKPPSKRPIPSNTSQITSITSTIIDSVDKIKYLIDYIKENDKSFNFKELKLLFRGSRDGDKTKTCHELCDKKPNVLIIIKSDSDFIFGGYSKIGFKTCNNYNEWEYKVDNNSFLFSLNLKKIYPVIKDKEVIVNQGEDFGLCFDKSLSFLDKFMEKDFNKIDKKMKKMFNGVENSFEMNGGKDKFICKDLEVFQLL